MTTPAQVADAAAAGQLALANLRLAGPTAPSLDPDGVLQHLAALADDVAGTDHMALRRIIAIREGIGGNADDYYDPRNSFIHEILDRRKGIPIALAVIWMEVGRLAGIEVTGVGLPGHFLIHAAGQLVDPFHGGEAIGSENAAQLVAESIGGPPRLDPAWLDPVPPLEIARRMCANLVAIAESGRAGVDVEWVRACQEEILTRG